ncbi:MAG: threonine-phosphate decarboxylase [Firmicutes bacterium HGW-Firmicutes-1]|jgi:threonine-phosphate decarboxylase|nr:MAG: threonine-phosphate decarboxylase [Firmicutes bacterium HGW-Firmicutes-1]
MNVHGGYFGNNRKEILDFSVNLNPLGVPESVKNNIINNLGALDTYPEIEARTAREHLAREYGLKSSNIIMGNGAVELIYLLAKTVKPKKVLLVQPTFNEYERAFKQSNTECIHYFLKANDDFELNLEDLFYTILIHKPEVMVMCNPNNPTASYIENDSIEKILEALKSYGGILMIDESFSAFENLPTAISLLHHENLFLLRSMTKYYSIAGIRLGYGIGAESITGQMQLQKEPWTLNSIACNIVEVLLQDKEYQLKTQKWYQEEKNYFVENIKKIPFLYTFDSKANFFLCRCEIDSEEIKNRLLAKGIFIRTCNDFTSLEGKYIRIALRSRVENKLFFEALLEIQEDLKEKKELRSLNY